MILTLDIYTGSAATPVTTTITATVRFEPSAMHHIAAVVDTSMMSLWLYVDGALLATKSILGAQTPLLTSLNAVECGGGVADVTSAENPSTTVHLVRVYSTAKPADKIQASMRQTSTEFENQNADDSDKTIILSWRFDDKNGNNIFDHSSQAANNGTIVGTPTWKIIRAPTPSVPSAPTGLDKEVDLTSVTLSWQYPAADGGAAVMKFYVESIPITTSECTIHYKSLQLKLEF
jgi:hypothetical protein